VDGFSHAIKENPLIEELIHGGVSQFYNKNFFWYSGSESTPPCKEGVQHFVMETPIRLRSVDFNLVKKAVINSETNPEGNNRKLQAKGLR